MKQWKQWVENKANREKMKALKSRFELEDRNYYKNKMICAQFRWNLKPYKISVFHIYTGVIVYMILCILTFRLVGGW